MDGVKFMEENLLLIDEASVLLVFKCFFFWFMLRYFWICHSSASMLFRFFKALYMMSILIASFKASIYTCKTWGWKKLGGGILLVYTSCFLLSLIYFYVLQLNFFLFPFTQYELIYFLLFFCYHKTLHIKRAGADDKPLRMVKTVLHELVKLRGAAIKGHLSMVPIDMKPQPIILAYIDLNLEVVIQ